MTKYMCQGVILAHELMDYRTDNRTLLAAVKVGEKEVMFYDFFTLNVFGL